MMDVMEATRVDRWLWAVRLTKTRPDAAAACRGGHVRINDRPAKPSTTVVPGDRVQARVGDTTRIVEVVRVIQKRVGAADIWDDDRASAERTPAYMTERRRITAVNAAKIACAGVVLAGGALGLAGQAAADPEVPFTPVPGAPAA